MTSSTLEQPVEEQEPLLKRIADAVNTHDHINYRDPLGWETLRDRWVNKTIGKDWREGQMSDIWDVLPDEWKPGVKKAATEFGQHFAEGWQDRRTIEGKEFLNPLAYTDFAVTRGLETIGIPFEWMAQGISKASGLDIELARIATDFVPVAGIAGAVGKKINKARLANRLKLLQKTPVNKTQALRAAIKTGDKAQIEAAVKAISEPSEELAQVQALRAQLDDAIDGPDPLFLKKFDEIGLTDDVKLEINKMIGNEAENVTKYTSRTVKMGISNPQYGPKVYKRVRTEIVGEFLDGLEFLGIDPSTIHAHHISGLRQTASLFEGLTRDQFRDILRLIMKEGIFAGNDPRNLKALFNNVHKSRRVDLTPVHRYLDEALGIYGEKLVGPNGSKIKHLKPEDRIPFIKKFAEIVKQSNVIMEDAVRKQLDLLVQADSPMAAAIAALDISEFEDSIDKLLKLAPNEVPSYLPAGDHYPNKDALIDLIFNENVTTSSEALRSRGVQVNKPIQGTLLEIRKRIKKRKNRKKPEIDPWDDSPVGSSWDITDPTD